MRKLVALVLLLSPSFCAADRLGSLRSGADVLLTTQTAVINTFSSSVTVNGANGVLVKYQVNAGSMTGAGLTNCGDSSHAVSWNSTTNLFGCQSIAGSGSSGTSTLAVGTGSLTGYTGVVTSSPTTIILFDSATLTSQFIGGTTVFIGVNGSSVTKQGVITAATLGAVTSVTGTSPINSSGGATPAISLSTMIGQTETFTSSVTLTGGISISSGISISIPSIITSTTTLTTATSVVLASCTARGTSTQYITLTLPDAAASSGADIMIYDVGTDSCSIRIAGAGTDVIESTGIIQLNAKFQHASLHSLGSIGWGAGLGGIQYTPPTIWTTQDDVGVFGVSVSSSVYQCPVYIPVPFSLLGFRVAKPTSSGNASFGLWNMNMGTTPIVTLSSQTLTGNPSNYLLSTAYNGAPGWYRIGVQLSNTSMQITGSNSVNDTVLFCSVGATPSGTGLDLSTITLTTGGARNGTYAAVDLLLNGGVLTN